MAEIVKTQQIIFFIAEDNSVYREMMFAEFEAVLDGVVGIDDMANSIARGVYCEINVHLKPISMVYFLVEFDGQGEPPRTWNVPFSSLIQKATPKTVHGAQLRQVTQSECGIEWQRDSLWDPTDKTVQNVIQAIDTNNLCLPGEPMSIGGEHATLQPNGGQQQAVFNQQTTGLHTTTNDAYFQDTMQNMEQQLRAAKSVANEYEDKNRALNQQLFELQQKFGAYSTNAQNKIQTITKEFQQRLQKKVEACEKQSKEQMEAQISALHASLSEKETNYQLALKAQHTLEHKVKQMTAELLIFRRDKIMLLKQGADEFFLKLEVAGLSFIAFHPGAGHVSVSVDNMTQYLDNPVYFAAAKCGITEDAYRIWLTHHEKPVCQAPLSSGECCGKRISRTENPNNYTPGISDRCERHKTGVSAAGRVFSS